MDLSLPARSLAIRRQTAILLRAMGWAPLHEVPLPNGRRADILALRPDGCFACIEVKSGVLDFQADAKWPEYRDFADALYFAVDCDFPARLIPAEVGLIITSDADASVTRQPLDHPLPPARRRALLHRFATLAACRLEQVINPTDAFPLACE
jgi:hypothetical protein